MLSRTPCTLCSWQSSTARVHSARVCPTRKTLVLASPADSDAHGYREARCSATAPARVTVPAILDHHGLDSSRLRHGLAVRRLEFPPLRRVLRTWCTAGRTMSLRVLTGAGGVSRQTPLAPYSERFHANVLETVRPHSEVPEKMYSSAGPCGWEVSAGELTR